jgi:transposase
MPDRELQALRRLLAQVTRGRGRRYPTAVRERVRAWATERRGRGDRWDELSRELGIPPDTLQRWATPHGERAMELRPVAVLEASDPPPCRRLTIVAPGGLRIEGVTVADAIAILRGLT